MLDQGHVIESGTYEELMAQNGVFADMVRRQQVSYNQEE
jgi:ATP-binding cassette subfamily C protein